MLIPSNLLIPETTPKTMTVSNMLVTVRGKSIDGELSGGVEIIAKSQGEGIDPTILGVGKVTLHLKSGWNTNSLRSSISKAVSAARVEEVRLKEVTKLMKFVDANFDTEQAGNLVKSHSGLTNVYENMTLQDVKEWTKIFNRSLGQRKTTSPIRTLFS